MKTIRSPVGVAFLSFVLTCGCTPAVSDASCSVNGTAATFAAYPLPGEVARVDLALELLCEPNQGPTRFIPPAVDGVQVSVLDPDNNAVASRLLGVVVSGFNAGAGNRIVATVSFTPDRPGAWHVSAAFEPGIGVAQMNLQVLEWRGDAGSRASSWSGPSDCEKFEQTSQGTVLCIRPVSDGGLRELVTQYGQVLSAGSALMVEGDVLWMIAGAPDSHALERYQDDGGVFVLTHLSVGGFAAEALLRPAGDDAWLATNDGSRVLRRAHPEVDGGLTLEEIGAPALDAGRDRAMVAATDEVLFDSPPGLLLISLDGGSKAISMPPAAKEDLPVPCGSDAESLWQTIPGLLLATAPASGTVIKANMLLPDVVILPRPKDTVNGSFPPIIPCANSGPLTAVPRFSEGQLSLEIYDAGADFTIFSASRRHVFARSGDGGTLKIFDR